MAWQPNRCRDKIRRGSRDTQTFSAPPPPKHVGPQPPLGPGRVQDRRQALEATQEARDAERLRQKDARLAASEGRRERDRELHQQWLLGLKAGPAAPRGVGGSPLPGLSRPETGDWQASWSGKGSCHSAPASRQGIHRPHWNSPPFTAS